MFLFPFFYYQLQSMFLVLSSAVSKTRSTSSLLSPHPPVVLPFYLSLSATFIEMENTILSSEERNHSTVSINIGRPEFPS